MRFVDQFAVVAGASEDIGKATVRRLLEEGARVLSIARDAVKLVALVYAAREKDTLVTLAADVALPAAGPTAVDIATREFRQLDVLVNCVGGSTVITNPPCSVDGTTDDDWSRLMAFNLQPMLRFIGAGLPVVKSQRSVSIVNLSSIAGRGRTDMTSAAYAAAKGAVNSFTARVARELVPQEHPCEQDSIGPHSERAPRDGGGEVVEFARAALLNRIWLGRAATVEEQAAVNCFLASQDAAHVTGVTLDVPGAA